MFRSLADPDAGHLENCPLDEVLAHEFGHWIVAEEVGIRPEGIAVYGIVYDGLRAIASKGAGVPFSTTFRPSHDEAAMYAAGHVAEHLYKRATTNPSNLYDSFLADASCLYDLAQVRDVLRGLDPIRYTDESSLADGVTKALRVALDILAPRADCLARESRLVASDAIKKKSETLELSWNVALTARLCDRSPDWYEVP